MIPSLPTASVSRGRWASTSVATGSGSMDAPGTGRFAGGAHGDPGARQLFTRTEEGSSTYKAPTIVAQNRLLKKKLKKNYKNRDLFYFLLEFIVTDSFYNKALKTSYFIEYIFVFEFESIFKMGITNSVF